MSADQQISNEGGNGDNDESFVSDQDVLEEINPDDGDHPMDDDNSDDNNNEGDSENVEMLNDSAKFFETHKQSIFSIAQHPTIPEIIATGGGDDVAYIWTLLESSSSIATVTGNPEDKQSQPVLFKLDGYKDSVTTLDFSANGEFLIAGGLDGRISIVHDTTKDGKGWKFLTFANEVEEVNWVSAHPKDNNIFAAGANDGSVWIYTIDPTNSAAQLIINHALYKHTGSCTASAWGQDGSLLATVSEDGSFYVHNTTTGELKVGYGAGEDARFNVDGGLFSVAINPAGTIAVVGGATGECKVVSLPGANDPATGASASGSKKGKSQKFQQGGAGPGSLLSTLAAQNDGVETMAFSPTLPLLATGSVDGTIVLYDTARWAVRRTLQAHDHAVVKIEFVKGSGGLDAGWELTSCSIDGTIRRWDCRSGEARGVWRGHADDSEGVLGFVQRKNGVIVSAGDDGIALVFETTEAPVQPAAPTGGP